MPPKNLARWFIAGGVVVVAIVVAVMVKIGSAPRVTRPESLDLVNIQVRSSPAFQPVTLDGHPKGKTPLMIKVPRGDEPREITVDLQGHALSKKVVPADDMVVDFKL
ncbi:MAG TPA: PEGA domain-containing protein [Kofleriaceae bacterium]|nr:PEGA domain-containing protein [Kofleriaceae bacterium]